MRQGLTLAAALFIGACARIASLDTIDDPAQGRGDDDDDSTSGTSSGKPSSSSGSASSSGQSSASSTGGAPDSSTNTSSSASSASSASSSGVVVPTSCAQPSDCPPADDDHDKCAATNKCEKDCISSDFIPATPNDLPTVVSPHCCVGLTAVKVQSNPVPIFNCRN